MFKTKINHIVADKGIFIFLHLFLNMTYSYLLAWFLFMAPIVYSAGPNNLICAALGSQAPKNQFIRYLAGANITIVFMTIAIGFGLNMLLEKWPLLKTLIAVFGALFLVYMAVKFVYRPKNSNEASTKELPDVKEAVIINLFNPKGIVGVSIMFNTFLILPYPKTNQIFILSGLTVVISLSAHLLWWAFGQWFLKRFSSPRAQKIQGWVFGATLFIVALWMLWSYFLNP